MSKILHVKTPESESGLGTRLTYEDGTEVHGVRSVTVRIDAIEPTVIDLHIAGGGSLDAHGIPRFHVCDLSDNGKLKEVKRIEFADGSIWIA